MKIHDIVECSGNLQVSRKPDTYYLVIKEDSTKFYCFSLNKTMVFVGGKKQREINHMEYVECSEMTFLFGFTKLELKKIT